MGQQRQGCFEHAPLLTDVMRPPQGRAAFETGGGGAGGVGAAVDSGVPTGQSCGDAAHFQTSCDQSHGLSAERSGGDK